MENNVISDSAMRRIMNQTGIKDQESIIRMLNSGELIVSKKPKWRKDEWGNIHFDVTSNGTTGKGWIDIFQKDGLEIGEYERENILNSKYFKPTNGITSEIVILKQRNFCDADEELNYVDIKCRISKRRGFSMPNAEVVCLILKKFSKEELETMGMPYIIVMSPRFKSFSGTASYNKYVPGIDNHNLFCSTAETWFKFKLNSRGGFAFVENSYPACK